MNTPAPPEYWVLDGFEDTPAGRLARLEQPGGSTVDLNAELLPPNSREGDVLEVISGPDGNQLQLAPAETQRRRQQHQQLLDALNADGATEEIIL